MPIVVANDGDVTALAGAMGLECGSVMGMAMGTSEAVGYVDRDGNVLGWLNELAFAPVDLNEEAMADEWSTDRGVGCKYFSQDAVIVGPQAGIQLDEGLTPGGEAEGSPGPHGAGRCPGAAIYDSIGAYLAYTVVLYSQFYELRHHCLGPGHVRQGWQPDFGAMPGNFGGGISPAGGVHSRDAAG